MSVENSREYKTRELQKQSRCSSFSQRERERENGGFRSDFVPDIFPEGHARPGTSLLVLLIARAPFATSFATMDLFCPDRSFCQVNDEIEANIQITREIESEIVKCSEIETALALRESDLTKTLYVSHFEINGFAIVAGI